MLTDWSRCFPGVSVCLYNLILKVSFKIDVCVRYFSTASLVSSIAGQKLSQITVAICRDLSSCMENRTFPRLNDFAPNIFRAGQFVTRHSSQTFSVALCILVS